MRLTIQRIQPWWPLSAEDRMPESVVVPASPRCVWMDAGVVRYRLCDRGFDCDHCLLNAALCADPPPVQHAADERTGRSPPLPTDRLYCPGHTWLLASSADPTRWRFGIDTLAAALIGPPRLLSWPERGESLATGQPACTIDSDGCHILLLTPTTARMSQPNEALVRHPRLLLEDPLQAGWVCELEIRSLGGLLGFLSPAAASDRISLDLTRFRRALAIQLIAHDIAGPAFPTAGQPLDDLRHLVGASRYGDLLREFIH